MSSLWGKLPEIPKITTPAKILSEQAALLQDQTGGIIVGDVASTKQRVSASNMAYELRAIVPSLNNYRLRLLHVEHGVLSYPCRVVNLRSSAQVIENINDEAQFLGFVASVLGSEDLMKLFSNLIAQSQALSES